MSPKDHTEAQSTDELVRQAELKSIRYSLNEITEFLDDDMVTDIWCDSRGVISIKSFGGVRSDTKKVLSIKTVRSILLQVAKFTEVPIYFDVFASLEGTIPIWNARITGMLPPQTAVPEFTIRKPPKKIFSLEEYVESGRLSQEYYDLICSFIKDGKNIVVSGATGSGKTTFANAILKKMTEFNPSAVFYIIEDNAELQCSAKYTTYVRVKRNSVQPVMALETALRWTPTYLVFGEVRDGKVLYTLLEAFNTGHPGFTTIHAESCEITLMRMRDMLGQLGLGELPQYNKIVNLIVHLRGDKELGCKVDEILDTSNVQGDYLESLYQKSFRR